MSEQIIEDDWPLGWCPSYSSQADFGGSGQALLRMDNLSLDEHGSIRLANRPTAQGSVSSQANSIYGAYVNGMKLRYVYTSTGTLLRNYGAAASLTTYDNVIATGGVALKAAFLNALGHVIVCAGTLQYKDRGDIQWPLQIPQPAPPVLTNLAANTVSLANLDGSGDYTNWTSIASTAFNNSSTNVNFQPAATTNVSIIQTIYSSLIDTTNFGATGQDTDNDPFVFTIQISDPTQLNWFKIEFICTNPTSGITDEYWAELDYANFATNTDPNNPYVPANPFTLTPGTPLTVYIDRSSFQRLGNNGALNWTTIQACRFSVGFLGNATFTFSNPFVQSGAVTGALQYVAVERNDTGQFVQWSIASTVATVTASLNHVTVDRSGTNLNSQCNSIRFYRNDSVLGQFIEVNRQDGLSYGGTPAAFTDNLSDTQALANAAVDTTKVLNYYRTQLPTNIIGMIYFASRVIYLTTSSFFPSFQLDFGSYDSRFTYELTGTNAELCLFITRLSVGTFIVATTVDFYQVSGTFNLISTTNADGTVTTTQDVTVQPLGVSDPAINSSYFEVEGNVFYMSSRGLRSMSNGVSSLLNTTTDLLFRNEARYGFPAVSLLPNDQSLIGMVSSGTRLYNAVPFTDGTNRILVNTYNAPLPTELRGATYWRPLLTPATCLAREQDGTVIAGSANGAIVSLEDSFSGTYPIYFLTQFNYGQHPTQTKTLASILLGQFNTGGNVLTLTVNGLLEDGITVISYTTNVSSAASGVVAVDAHATLINCIAYQVQITGTTSVFELGYFAIITAQEYPPLTFYAIMPFSNLGKDTLKKLSKWGFVIDTLGNEVTAKVTADDKIIDSTIDQSAEPQGISTEFWYNENDVAALDWQLEIIAPQGMHFFKFMNPDILQVFPPGRMIDQFGPLDLDREGIVFGMRLRVLNEGVTLHYQIYDNDVAAYSNDLATTAGLDVTIEETFPKGINTSVFRLVLSAPTVFYRFSLEIKVRSTGKETEQKWVKIGS